MKEKKRVVVVDGFEQRLLVNGLMDFREDVLRDGSSTGDVEDLILKVIDAPTRKEKRRRRHEIE